MAPKHGEVTRQLADGWTLAWDSTDVDPAMRKATDRIVAENVASLQELLDLPAEPVPVVVPRRRASRRRRAAAA